MSGIGRGLLDTSVLIDHLTKSLRGIKTVFTSDITTPSTLDDMVYVCYDLHMRTTIALDDGLAERVRRRAAEEGLSVSAFIAKTLDDVLKQQPPISSPPFKLVTVKGNGPSAGFDLDRPRALETEEDAARFGTRRSSV
jgi:hypothetical protein